MSEPPEDSSRPPPITPAARAAGGDRRQLSRWPVRDRLLPPVVPAGPLGRPVRPGGARNRVRQGATIAAPRGEILDPNGNHGGRQRAAPGADLAAGSAGAGHPTRTLAHPPRADAALYNRARSRLGMPTKRQPCRATGTNVLALSPIACAVGQKYVRPTPTRRWRTDSRARSLVLPGREPGAVPGRQRPEGLPARLSVRRRWPPRCWAPSARSPASEVKEPRLHGRGPPTSSASRAWRPTTTATCAAGRRPAGPGQRARAASSG